MSPPVSPSEPGIWGC